jgi:iron complex transport system ATP-binding protein
MNVDISGLHKHYQRRLVLDGLQFNVQSGEFFGIVGPNGSGKSTLLKLLSGIEQADAGKVMLDGRLIQGYAHKQLARQVAVMLQHSLPEIDYTVREVVEMGRFPFQNWFGDEWSDSKQFIDNILFKFCLEHLAQRSLRHLSGGERQRVAMAKAMAQQPRLLLLDEPTTYLDIGFQMQMMDMIRQWQTESHLTVIAVLHDLNLAAQYCDRLLILNDGHQVAIGTPTEMMHDDLLASVYGTKPIVLSHPVSLIPQILLQPGLTHLN